MSDLRDLVTAGATAGVTAPSRPRVLRRDEGMALLGGAAIGRVVYSVGALPAVRVVNFALDAGDVVFRVRRGSRMASALTGTIVAFEADQVDPENRIGWTVTVTGHAEEVTSPPERDRLLAALEPYAQGVRECVIRIRPELVAGRVVGGSGGGAR